MSALLLSARADFLHHARPSIDYCRAAGIDWAATEPATGGLFLAGIRPAAPHRFDFDEAGTEAAIVEAFDEFGDTVDLVAWPTADPSSVMTAIGSAAVLGAAIAADPTTYFGGRPLQVFRRPLDWLRARCGGVVLLDMKRGARWLNDQPGRIAAEDAEHAREIRAAMLATVDTGRIVLRPNTKRAA